MKLLKSKLLRLIIIISFLLKGLIKKFKKLKKNLKIEKL
jgi:hypothetical protein